MPKRKIVDFRVTQQTDHEQYWSGHGIAFTNYSECATGCGNTPSEALEDALDSLAQLDIEVTHEQETAMRAELVRTDKPQGGFVIL